MLSFYFKKMAFTFLIAALLCFFNPKFHPMQHDNLALAEEWLADHPTDFNARSI